MKIEVTCIKCKSVLSVGQEHGGKQVRCPSCGGLSTIPVAAEDLATPEIDNPPIKSNAQAGIDQDCDDPALEFERKQKAQAGQTATPVTPSKATFDPSAPLTATPIYDTDEVPTAQVVPPMAGRRSPTGDASDTVALILGGLALASNVVCGCVAPVIAPVLSIIGLVLVRKSKGPYRRTAVVTNIIALVLAVVSAVVWFFLIFLS